MHTLCNANDHTTSSCVEDYEEACIHKGRELVLKKVLGAIENLVTDNEPPLLRLSLFDSLPVHFC